MRSARAVVVGAGAAGLAAAWRLARGGLEVSVLEREGEAGGRARAAHAEGFAFDRGGHLVSSADRNLLAWIEEIGLVGELLPLREVEAAQWIGGRLRPSPDPLRVSARAPGVRFYEALRLLRLPRLIRRFGEGLDPAAPEKAAAQDDRSLADFARLYFGTRVLDRWLGPYLASRTLGDAEDTSRALFLLRVVAERDARRGVLRAPLAELWRALGDRLQVRCRAEAESVEPAASGALLVNARDAEALEADAVVLAVPAQEAGRLARSLLTPAERDFLSALAWRPAIVLAAGIDGALAARPRSGRAARRSRAKEGPSKVGPRLVQCARSEGLPIETFLVEPGGDSGRAPRGSSLVQLRATSAWAAGHLEAPQETLEKECLGLLERIAPEVRGRVRFARVDRFARAVPAFRVGDYRRLERFLRVQADRRAGGRRLYFAGDHLAGPSLEAAQVSGLRAADAVLEDLGSR